MKLFETILQNLDKINDDIFLKTTLIEYNVWKIFDPIYATNKEVRLGNICTSFIILAYSNGCHWLDYSKDRMVTKLEVISSITTATNTKVGDVTKAWIDDIVNGRNESVESCISEFVCWQKNGLFETYIALSTQISLCRKEASNSFGITAKMLNDRAKFLENLRHLEADLDDVIHELEKQYQPLDEVLKQEGKLPISKRTEKSSWETMVSKMNNDTNS